MSSGAEVVKGIEPQTTMCTNSFRSQLITIGGFFQIKWGNTQINYWLEWIKFVLVKLLIIFENYNTVRLPFRVLTFVTYKVTYFNEMLRRKSTWDKTIYLRQTLWDRPFDTVQLVIIKYELVLILVTST